MRYFGSVKKFVLILFCHMNFEKVGKAVIQCGILGRFVKFQKAVLVFVMSVPMEQLCSHWTDFHKI
jgi:hypothetical protein